MSDIPKLTDDEREKIECMVEQFKRGDSCTSHDQCLRCNRCDQMLGNNWCPKLSRDERAKALQRVLDDQPKPLAFTMPESLSDEQMAWLESSVKKERCFVSRDINCSEACYGWVESRQPGKMGCRERPRTLRLTPEYLDMFRDILAHHKLPPHNVIQFEQEEYDAWTKWLTRHPSACPRRYNYHVNCRSKSVCMKIFPELTKCPCNQYSPEITRTVIEKCIALGPKEEFEKYYIWWTDKCLRPEWAGKMEYVVREEGRRMIFDNGECLDIDRTEAYTKTPPPPEEPAFEQYVAVTVRGNVVYIIDILSSGLTLHSSAGGIYHKDDLTRLTNPRKARDMLNKQLGEESIVEEIKERMRVYALCYENNPHVTHEHAQGHLDAYMQIRAFITELERKAKCPKS